MKIFLLEDELSQQIRVEKHIEEIAGSLSDVLEKDVENRYFSPHQSYLVNRSMIIGMDKKKKHLLLKEGYSCPISRSNIKRVKKLIEEENLEFSA